jgi:hypothetical protein
VDQIFFCRVEFSIASEFFIFFYVFNFGVIFYASLICIYFKLEKTHHSII